MTLQIYTDSYFDKYIILLNLKENVSFGLEIDIGVANVQEKYVVIAVYFPLHFTYLRTDSAVTTGIVSKDGHYATYIAYKMIYRIR